MIAVTLATCLIGCGSGDDACRQAAQMGRSVTDSLWAAIGRYDQALQASTAIGVAAGVTYGRAAQLETDAQILRSGDYAKFQDLLAKCGN